MPKGKKGSEIDNKNSYQVFLDTNMQLIRDHFQMLLLFEVNLFGLTVLDQIKVGYFKEKCIIISAIFFFGIFAHIYETIFKQSSSN